MQTVFDILNMGEAALASHLRERVIFFGHGKLANGHGEVIENHWWKSVCTLCYACLLINITLFLARHSSCITLSVGRIKISWFWIIPFFKHCCLSPRWTTCWCHRGVFEASGAESAESGEEQLSQPAEERHAGQQRAEEQQRGVQGAAGLLQVHTLLQMHSANSRRSHSHLIVRFSGAHQATVCYTVSFFRRFALRSHQAPRKCAGFWGKYSLWPNSGTTLPYQSLGPETLFPID